MYNKIEDNYHLSNKKALFLNMKYFYEAVGENPYNALPVTFHVKAGLEDPEYQEFRQFYLDAKQAKQSTLRARVIEHAAHSCVEHVRGDGVRRILLLVSCHGNVERVLVSQSHVCSASM